MPDYRSSLVRLFVSLCFLFQAAPEHASAFPPQDQNLGPPSAHECKHLLHQLVGDDLKAFAGVSPTILIAQNPLPNAFARGDATIVVTTGLLSQVKDTNELSFVLAHELGHLMKHRTPRAVLALLPGTSRLRTMLELEFEADSFALELLKNAGISPSVALSILERNGNFGAEYGAPLRETHPSLNARIERIRELSREP